MLDTAPLQKIDEHPQVMDRMKRRLVKGHQATAKQSLTAEPVVAFGSLTMVRISE
ncbi:hypothetical protein D3C85_819740 [compost metagenome]